MERMGIDVVFPQFGRSAGNGEVKRTGENFALGPQNFDQLDCVQKRCQVTPRT